MPATTTLMCPLCKYYSFPSCLLVIKTEQLNQFKAEQQVVVQERGT